MKTCMSTLVSCICIAAQGKNISGVKDADNASKLNQYPKCMYVCDICASIAARSDGAMAWARSLLIICNYCLPEV